MPNKAIKERRFGMPVAQPGGMTRTVIEDCRLLDATEARGYRCGIYIVVEGDRIVAMESRRPEGAFDRSIPASRLLAIPGLINAHTHSPESLGRASHDKLPLEPWLFHMIAGLGEFTPRAHYVAAALTAMETIRSGGTAILDHLTLPGGYRMEVLDAAMEAYRDCGIRARVAPLLRDPSEAVLDGHWARTFAPRIFGNTEELMPDVDDLFALAEAFLDKWHGAANGRLMGHVGPGGIQWATVPFLHRCEDLARRKGVGVHTHLMETRVQDQTARELFGMGAVALLERENLLGPHWSLPHSIWLSRQDVERIARAGAVPVHNPAANMRLGSGWSPLRRFLDNGCLPALGADGSMSGDHQNLFVVLHLAAQIHNAAEPDPDSWIGAAEVVEMATRGGARALMQEGELGSLEPGKRADITLLDLGDLSLTPFHHAFYHLAYTVPTTAVHTVLVDGQPVLEAKRFTMINEADLLAEARELAAGLPLSRPAPPDVEAEIRRLRDAHRQLLATTRFIGDESAPPDSVR